MPAQGIQISHFHDALDHAPSQYSIDAQELAKFIGSAGRGRFLHASEFLDRAISGRLSDHHLCLTFDDGLLCQYDIAVPVLEDFGLTAFFFVNTSVMQGNIERHEIDRHFSATQFGSVNDFYAAFFVRMSETEFAEDIDRSLANFNPSTFRSHCLYLSDADRRFRFVRDDVLGPAHFRRAMDTMMREANYDVRRAGRELWMTDAEAISLHRAGHVIGLHSHTHPTVMRRLDEEEQQYEYRANASHLTALLGEPPLAMSHPSDSYDHRTLNILRSLDVRVGFRSALTNEKRIGDPLEWPRLHHAAISGTRRKAA